MKGEFVFCPCGEGDAGGDGVVMKERFWNGNSMAGLGLAVWGAEACVGVVWGEFRIASSGTETIRSLGVSVSVIFSVVIGSTWFSWFSKAGVCVSSSSSVFVSFYFVFWSWVDVLAFFRFFLDFLSAAADAGPFEAAIRAAVVILADCSFVTALGSLVSSADICGLWEAGCGSWSACCQLGGFVFSSVRALSALVGLVAPWLVPYVFIGLVLAFGGGLLVVLSPVLACGSRWVGWVGLCLGLPVVCLGCSLSVDSRSHGVGGRLYYFGVCLVHLSKCFPSGWYVGVHC